MMSEALVEIFTSSLGGNVHFGFIILIAIVGVISFISLNVFAQHFGIKFSKFMTLVKFVPIIAVVLTGLIYGGINGISSSYFNMSSNNTTVGKFLPLAMLASLPAVLFAYDGFAAIGSLRSKIKEPEKNIPKAMLLAMLVV
jgi:amino acid transporter